MEWNLLHEYPERKNIARSFALLYLLSIAYLNLDNGWFYVFSPLFLAFQLYQIAGANETEPEMMTRKEDYASYVKNTSAFIPSFKAPVIPEVTEYRRTAGQ